MGACVNGSNWPGTSGTADQFLACAGISPAEPRSATLESYAHRVGTPSGWMFELTVACLMAHRLFYAKTQYNNLTGDCGSGAQLQYSGGNANLVKLSSGIAASGIGVASGLGVTTIAGISTAALGAAFAGIGLVALPFILIGAHHAQAVATEQETLCDVTSAYDTFAAQAEAAIAAGQLTLTNVLALAQSAGSALLAELNKIAATPGDAASGYKFCLQALILYANEVIYPSLATGQAPSAVTANNPAVPQVQATSEPIPAPVLSAYNQSSFMSSLFASPLGWILVALGIFGIMKISEREA